MSQEIYRIRSAIIVPLIIAVSSLFVLLLLSFLFKSLPGETFALSAVFLLALYLLLEVFSRRVTLKSVGVLEIRKFLRKKELAWEEITQVGCVVMGKKIYALLTTTRGFYILSNSYERFSDLLGGLSRNLSEERVEKEIHDLIEHPLQNNKPVRLAWFTVIIVIAVVILRFFI